MLHLKLLAKCNNFKHLSSAWHVKQSIISCISLVDMRPLENPRVIDVPLQLEKLNVIPFEDEGGITCQIIGYATLSTSHAAIHTWPLRNEFHFDLYSCREFNDKVILDYLTNWFDVTKHLLTDCSSGCVWDH